METSTQVPAGNMQPTLVWGWVLSALALVLPLLAIGGLIFGVIAVVRGRPGHGAGMIAVSLLAPLIWVYLASTTLVPA